MLDRIRSKDQSKRVCCCFASSNSIVYLWVLLVVVVVLLLLLHRAREYKISKSEFTEIENLRHSSIRRHYTPPKKSAEEEIEKKRVKFAYIRVEVEFAEFAVQNPNFASGSPVPDSGLIWELPIGFYFPSMGLH